MLHIYENCFSDRKITKLGVRDGVIVEPIPQEGERTVVTDLHGLHVYPGLVDIHTHGCVGCDTMDGTADSIAVMAEFLAKNGTLSWLPTTMTEDFEKIRRAVFTPLPENGAEVLGFHAEGPYINPSKRGAQNEKFIKNPDLCEFSALLGKKGVKLVTVAPEMPGAIRFIQNCGCVVSVGHTEADYDQTVAAAKAGATCLTHVFNAMPPLLHRAPGPIGAAIDENMYVQVICDGLHIQKSVIKMLYRTFGRDRMILISDSMRATGLSDGDYDLGGQTVHVRNSVARTDDGALAGSTSTLLDCVKKAVEFGIPEADAFYMASRTPCSLMSLDRKGRLDVGCDADFIALDEKLDIKLAVKGGRTISENK